MFMLLLVLWILFNGRLTWEIVGVGAVLCAALTFFCVRFLDYPIKKELALVRITPMLLGYLGTLVLEIWKSNMAVWRLGLKRSVKVSPVLVTFHTPLKSRVGKALLANSITLTPGTITALAQDDVMTVHCLDTPFAEGIEDTVFQRKLIRIEEAMGYEH